MPVREKLQQVIKGENIHFFFQQLTFERAYAFQVFNGISQYG
jgi:hypothetical protein